MVESTVERILAAEKEAEALVRAAEEAARAKKEAAAKAREEARRTQMADARAAGEKLCDQARSEADGILVEAETEAEKTARVLQAMAESGKDGALAIILKEMKK